MTTAIIKHGEDLHCEIDNIIKKLKSEMAEMDYKHLSVLTQQEDEITRIISEIMQSIAGQKKLLNSNDISLVSNYESRNAEFQKMPPKFRVSLSSFTPHKINKKQIYQQFGCLSSSSIKTEDSYPIDSPDAEFLFVDYPFINKPQTITNITTGCEELRVVSCLGDEYTWTSGNDKIMRLYNLQGGLVKSIQTMSGNCPRNIAVTGSGDLFYTDYQDKTVDIVTNKQIRTMISLKEWAPLYVCTTVTGNLLVIMNSDNNK